MLPLPLPLLVQLPLPQLQQQLETTLHDNEWAWRLGTQRAQDLAATCCTGQLSGGQHQNKLSHEHLSAPFPREYHGVWRDQQAGVTIMLCIAVLLVVVAVCP